MQLSRREFLVGTAALAAAAALPATGRAFDAPMMREPITWLHGDPYLASVLEGPLTGREFHVVRDQAMRFRTGEVDRDRYVLGLELTHA